MDLRKETIKTEGRKPLLDRPSLLASVDVIESQTTDPYSSLDLTNVIYNLSIYSRDETLKLIIIIMYVCVCVYMFICTRLHTDRQTHMFVCVKKRED
jgi:hypothetical protein